MVRPVCLLRPGLQIPPPGVVEIKLCWEFLDLRDPSPDEPFSGVYLADFQDDFMQGCPVYAEQAGPAGFQSGPHSGLAVFPSGPIFSYFGPNSDLFRQKGPKMVQFYTQKSDCDKNEEK